MHLMLPETELQPQPPGAANSYGRDVADYKPRTRNLSLLWSKLLYLRLQVPCQKKPKTGARAMPHSSALEQCNDPNNIHVSPIHSPRALLVDGDLRLKMLNLGWRKY